MKRYFLLILTILLLGGISASAQELRVTEINEITNSIKARTANVRDLNGDLCALVEVAVPSVKGISFDASKVLKSSYEDGIYSLFVPAGTKTISYKHSDYVPGTIDFAGSGVSVMGGSHYRVIMKRNDKSAEHQFLVINVTPKTAAVEVDGQSQAVTDGAVQMYLEVGTFHKYRVTAAGMRSEEGEAYMASADEKTTVNVNLVENTTPVRIVALDGAEIYINERLVGTGTWEGGIAPGTFRIEARMNGYTVADEARDISISDEVQQIELQLKHGTLMITSNVPNASILMDGKPVGETPLRKTDIIPGRHTLTISKDGYKPANVSAVVIPDEETTMGITLEALEQKQPKAQPAPKQKTEPEPAVKPEKAQKPAKVETPKPEKAPKPAKAEPDKFIFAGAALGYAAGSGTPSFGAQAGFAKKIGAYAKFRSNFNSVSAAYECDSSGLVSGDNYVWFDGEVSRSRTVFTVGGLVHLAGPLYPYAGVGFGSRNTYWRLSGDSDSAERWAKVTDYSCSGVAVEAGVMLKLGRVAITAGANCTAFNFTDIDAGLCITF